MCYDFFHRLRLRFTVKVPASHSGNSRTSSFTYSARNQKATASYPDSTGESWTYNAAGALATHVDGNSHTISYSVDNAGRETGISYPTGTNVSFSMDAAGRRTSMTDSTGTTGYTLDAAGRITQIAAPNGTVNYGYDDANRRISMSISGSTGSWSYSYDAANRMTSTTNPYSETSSMGYDNANRMISQTNGNSSLTSWVYDSANRVTDVWHKKSDNTTVLGHYAYSYDAVGNVTERDDNDSSVTIFGYDASDQLTSEARSVVGAYSVSYTYDHNGNRKTKVLGGVTDTYSYGNHDQLNSVSFGGGGSKSYIYDSNGNCTSVTVGTNVTNLSYDYENRVVGITYPSSATNSFQYNGLDLRTQKIDSAGTFNYTTDGTSPASAVLKDGAATYTPGLSEHRGSTSKFYHSDALGSTRGITDSSQAATDAVLYDAFGMTVSRTGTTPTPFGFVGKAQYQTDSDSGLQLLGHRYYDASIGRFISSDPAKAGTNWYAYCNNNPLTGIDPLGLWTWWNPLTWPWPWIKPPPPPVNPVDKTLIHFVKAFEDRPGSPPGDPESPIGPKPPFSGDPFGPRPVRPPSTLPPTDSERIAQLEKDVADLRNRVPPAEGGGGRGAGSGGGAGGIITVGIGFGVGAEAGGKAYKWAHRGIAPYLDGDGDWEHAGGGW